ncbi:MAG: LAGLIDADG family homing endonuclease [Nanoarchaeota archaeon]|nr:LAGLIDADG family homing endonuclease [Nanoarchaeota archaeon]
MPYDIIIGRDSADKEKFEKRGLIFLGKGYVKMGNYTSLSNKIWMDVARSHVILVAGKRGSGKCLHGDTLITLENGEQIPIKDLENNKENVLSLNEKLKIEKSKKSDFFSRKVNRLLKIKLRSGKEIKLTPEHPLFTIKGWEEAQKLNLGSRIATPRKLPCFGDKEMPEHEVKILSYLIAEGHTKKIVLFANMDEKIVSEFKESLKLFDPSLRLIKEKEAHYRISSPKWTNKVLEHNKERNEKGQFIKGNKNIYKKRSIRKLIEREQLFGLLSTEKYLSQNIMQLNKEQLSLFLNRLFSCDGSIYKTNNNWEISYCSSSEKLIKQVQNLLLRFGILSKLRNKRIKLNGKIFHSYELVLNGNNVTDFIDNIGFYGIKEQRAAIALKEVSKIKRNPNVDTIPKEIWQFYKPQNWADLGRAIGYKHPKAMRERVHYSPSRQTMLQIAKVENHNGLKMLAESDIFWDEIVSMEMLEGEFTVYDICVPKNHNFIANDIIVHNSYTLGAIAEEIASLPEETSKNIASIIFDTMGIFWTMKYKNEKEKELLDSWQLESKFLPAKVFIPFGKMEEYKQKLIPFDETFALKSSELEAEDWITLFNLEMTSPAGVLIERIITKMKESGFPFTLSEVQKTIEKDSRSSQETKEIGISLFSAADSWGIFAKTAEGTKIKDLINPGVTTILDISIYSSIGAFNIRALVISLVSRKLFTSRMDTRRKEEFESLQKGQDYLSYKSEREEPLIWIFVDEAHEFLPREGKTPATDALVQLLREGRQPGISLVLATQQPGQIHKDVMTQSDIIISHRVTAKPDIEALNEIMQTYLLSSIKQQIDDLPSLKGSAIVLDDNSERIYPIRVRPRFTWHGGEAPTAVKAEIKL